MAQAVDGPEPTGYPDNLKPRTRYRRSYCSYFWICVTAPILVSLFQIKIFKKNNKKYISGWSLRSYKFGHDESRRKSQLHKRHAPKSDKSDSKVRMLKTVELDPALPASYKFFPH